MTKSMTGYGKAQCEVGNKKVTIEIKSLNSKQADINSRIPSLFRSKDITIRKMVSSSLQRGKIDISLYYEMLNEESRTEINAPIVIGYFNQLKQIANELGVDDSSKLLEMAAKMPDTTKVTNEELNEEEWLKIEETLKEAISQLNEFRSQEGAALKADITSNISIIENLLSDIEPYEQVRIDTVKQRILDNLKSLEQSDKADSSRLEQEMIYYIEKFDINEEKVRLANHCSYFRETFELDEATGKKMGFISQEIGREINTIGSKANHTEIQKIVVQMKDALEKIKEQMLNVL